MKKCILGACPHGYRGCVLLHCGAEYALKRAQRPQGYHVLVDNNPTITGLERAGLIRVERKKWDKIGVARAV